MSKGSVQLVQCAKCQAIKSESVMAQVYRASEAMGGGFRGICSECAEADLQPPAPPPFTGNEAADQTREMFKMLLEDEDNLEIAECLVLGFTKEGTFATCNANISDLGDILKLLEFAKAKYMGMAKKRWFEQQQSKETVQ